jgi:Xaa-Pro aminopeptidase
VRCGRLCLMDHKKRVVQARMALEKNRLDGLLITHLPDVRYFCGFTGSSSVLVITRRDNILFTDGRYTQQAQQEVKTAKIRITPKGALTAAGGWLGKRKSSRKIGIQSAYLTVAGCESLRKSLRGGVRLADVTASLMQIRVVKHSEEIGLIRDACHLGAELFRQVLTTIRAGVTEAQVAGKLEFEARMAGAEQMSFPTIIASGERSALPHGRASKERIPPRGFVVCDFGVILAGYCSDMTRTVHVGEPESRARKVYEAVRDAQQAAVDAVKPGVVVGEVDQAARKLLKKRSLDKFFSHSTGHGVGLEIHEAPRVAANQKEVLRPGMVITIEPGVYMPGKWGVRIEDTVVVTETGCEILTPCSKELITL